MLLRPKSAVIEFTQTEEAIGYAGQQDSESEQPQLLKVPSKFIQWKPIKKFTFRPTSETALCITEHFQLNKDYDKYEQSIKHGVPSDFKTYIIGFIPGLKLYLKRQIKGKDRVIDEEIEWTDTKRIETKKVICGFENYECRGYQLKLRSSAAESSSKQIPYKLRDDVNKLTERYTAINDKYSSSFHEPLMFTLE